MLALNINPAQQRAAERGSRMQEKMFKSVALEWHSSKKNGRRIPQIACLPV